MKKSIFKNVIYKFCLNMFNLIVPIIIGTYVVRKLGPDLMGIINYSQAIFAYFFIFAGFGVYQYGLREISKVRDNKKKLEKTFTSLFLITIVTNIIIAVVYILFVKIQNNSLDMYVASIILTFNLFSNIFYVEWVNEALENYDFITIKTIIIRLINVFLIFIMVKSSNDYSKYLILLGLTTFLNNIASYIYVRKKIKFNFRNLELAKHIRPMLLVVILSNASVLYTQLDKVMLGKYIGTTEVAFYTMAQNISYMINTALLTLIHVSIPRLGNYIANKEYKKYIELLNRMSKIYLIILFPASIGMLLLSKEIIIIYGGMDYIKAFPILMTFSIYIITLGYEAILSNQVMYVNGREKAQVKIVLLFGILNTILNIIIFNMNIFNGVTALITTIISNMMVVFAQHFYIRKELKIEYNIFSFENSKYLLISILFIPITYIIRGVCKNMALQIFIIIAVNCIVYFSILLLIKDKLTYDLINKFKNKMKMNKIIK